MKQSDRRLDTIPLIYVGEVFIEVLHEVMHALERLPYRIQPSVPRNNSRIVFDHGHDGAQSMNNHQVVQAVWDLQLWCDISQERIQQMRFYLGSCLIGCSVPSHLIDMCRRGNRFSDCKEQSGRGMNGLGDQHSCNYPGLSEFMLFSRSIRFITRKLNCLRGANLPLHSKPSNDRSDQSYASTNDGTKKAKPVCSRSFPREINRKHHPKRQGEKRNGRPGAKRRHGKCCIECALPHRQNLPAYLPFVEWVAA